MSEEYERLKAKKKRLMEKKRRKRQICIRIAATVVVVGVGIGGVLHFRNQEETKSTSAHVVKELELPQPEMNVDLLTVNEYSRPGLALDKVNAIVIHYTANPGTTAQQNRDYFESLAQTHDTKVSSHFVVGIEGEIVQCIPTTEIAYASNNRNNDTVSVECCHIDETGEFSGDTYEALVELTAFLVCKYDLDPQEDVIRHYDVTGKLCPLYYVENEDAWEEFKDGVDAYIRENAAITTKE